MCWGASLNSSASDQISLADKLLLAAVKVSDAKLDQDFPAESLVVAAWQEDPQAFGLRGHEDHHPDSNKVYTKIDGRSGIVTKGWLAKCGERRLKLTEAGLARAARLTVSRDSDLQGKLERSLQDSVNRIVSHAEFRAWLQDRSKPDRFRGAGHFWGIAPGTPAATVRSRVGAVDATLREALRMLENRGLAEVLEHRGQVLFDRTDVEMALQFQKTLKERFKSDLRILDPSTAY
jgi:hypothetical protein